MKITKSQLKQVIKEVLNEAIKIGGETFTMEQPAPEEAAFEKLRKVMGLVEKAMLYMTGDKEGGTNPVEALDMARGIIGERDHPGKSCEEAHPGQEHEEWEKTLAEEKENNPWAICTASVGRENKEKYEKCVKSIKKQNRSK